MTERFALGKKKVICVKNKLNNFILPSLCTLNKNYKEHPYNRDGKWEGIADWLTSCIYWRWILAQLFYSINKAISHILIYDYLKNIIYSLHKRIDPQITITSSPWDGGKSHSHEKTHIHRWGWVSFTWENPHK